MRISFKFSQTLSTLSLIDVDLHSYSLLLPFIHYGLSDLPVALEIFAYTTLTICCISDKLVTRWKVTRVDTRPSR